MDIMTEFLKKNLVLKETPGDKEGEGNKETSHINISPTIIQHAAGESELVKKMSLIPLPMTLSTKYSSQKRIGKSGENLTEWKDDALGKLSAMDFKYLEDAELVDLGTQTFKEIQTSLTIRTLGKLFILAYNLKASDGTKVFGVPPEEVFDKKRVKPIDELSDSILISGSGASKVSIGPSPDSPGYSNKVATSYCYLACSYMRLFTKAPENYTKVQEHLKLRFTNFYAYDLALKDYGPDLSTVKRIHHQFSTSTLMRNSLYVLLCSGSINDANEGLRSFLYNIHLEYTGLHAYTLFTRCMEVLDVDNVELLNAMSGNLFVKQLDSIASIQENLLGNKEGSHTRAMWRYARLFNRQFMSSLQSKGCIPFIAMLAQILIIEQPASHAGVMNIAPLASLGAYGINQAKERAARTIAVINKLKADESIYSGI